MHDTYRKKLCMTEIGVARHRHLGSHYHEPWYNRGRNNSSIGFVMKGSVTFRFMGKTLHMKENDLFFIPEGLHYSSEWHGDPEIEFFAIYITSKKLDISENSSVFAFQKIDALSNPETGERIREIYRLFATEKRTEKLRALGLYYILYSEILPHLKEMPPIKYNPVLSEAMRYIDSRYREDFSVDELAAVCAVSASRLFHLFKSELGTTPLKYRNELRIERAALDLRISDHPMEQVASRHGFHSATYFREIFKSYTGLTPTEYRAMAQRGHAKGEEQ